MSLLANWHLTLFSWETVILIFFVVVIFLFGFALGRNRLIILLLSTYFSWIITARMPWQRIMKAFSESGLNFISPSNLKLLVFFGLLFFFWFFIPRSILTSVLRIKKKNRGSIFQISIFSILEFGLLMTIILSFLPPLSIERLSPWFQRLFYDQLVCFVWWSLPLIMLAIMKRRKRKVIED